MEKIDDMQEFDIELTVHASVKVNGEIISNYQEQYGLIDLPDLKSIARRVAQAISYAHISPMISGDVNYDTYFDGVCNMKGLISDVEVEIDN